METIIRSQSFENHYKKQYHKPAILQELSLETKAGSPNPPLGGSEAPIMISPPGFTINSDEP
jgi:hypothetical protein